ncbi:MAG: glycosyltransferase family 39 protein [Anaerolineales bacterium]|nr:glycosyltransferase family 39 protein [Anaerolineales bacterium]
MTMTAVKFSETPSVRRYWPEALILLVAALVRCWRLDYHSFWFDETVSLDWAEDGAGYIWQSTFTLLKDKHPPGYYLLLHAWQNIFEVFGLQHNDAALRTLGAALGVLTVLGVLLLARRLSGRTTGLLAATLTALAPVLVWYSQELRMFQPATTGLVWGAYCLLRGWQGETRLSRLGWWLGMVAAFTFALYSYLFSALLLPAAGLTLVGLWAAARLEITRTKKLLQSPISNLPISQSPNPTLRFLQGATALTLTGLLFLPLARNAWLVNASEGAPGEAFMDFFANLQRQLQIFTVWRAPWPVELVGIAVVFFAGLLLVGLAAPWLATRQAVSGQHSETKHASGFA